MGVVTDRIPMIKSVARRGSANTHQNLQRELIKSFVRQHFLRNKLAVEDVVIQLSLVFSRVLANRWNSRDTLVYLGHDSLNLTILVPAPSLILQDEISPHTAACKISDTVIVLRT